MGYRTFETERLFLRPTGKGDADFILELMNSPKWLAYIGDRQVYTAKQAEAYIDEKMTSQLERLGFGNYTVIRKEDGAKLGSCGLYDREGLDGVDLGFAFLPEYEGQGYGYEAALRLMGAGWEDFGLDQIRAITNTDNQASQKLLQKLGFRQEGRMTLPGETTEVILFTAKKWIPNR